MIHTGNNFLKIPSSIENKKLLLEYHSLSNFVPMLFRANDNPDLIGNYERNVTRDYCYMGAPYRKDWVPKNFSGIYHSGEWNTYLNYNKRKEIYLSSMFALGFQSDTNIDAGHLSQRLFEGMAYGCIVFCENKLAEEYTNGIIVYVSSKEDLCNKMSFYKNNPNIISEKQQKGYKWIKEQGTNRYSIKMYIDKIKDLWNFEFK
jgi:spore maturation protein CgeB